MRKKVNFEYCTHCMPYFKRKRFIYHDYSEEHQDRTEHKVWKDTFLEIEDGQIFCGEGKTHIRNLLWSPSMNNRTDI